MLNDSIKAKVLSHLKMITKTDNWNVVYPGIEARQSIVYRLVSPQYSSELALKIYNSKLSPIKFQYQAQEEFYLKNKNRKYRVPKPYGFFEDDGFFIMEWIEGDALSDLLWRNCFSKVHLQKNIRRSYEWLNHYHSHSDLSYKEVDCFSYSKSIESNLKRRESQNFFYQNSLFSYSFETLRTYENHFIGYKTKHANLHGDLNLGNILVNENSVVGIDIGASSHLPVQNDIAEMLTHICVNYFLMLPRSAIRQPMSEWEIFDVALNAYGYPVDKKARDFFLFVFLHQSLQRWITTKYFHDKNKKYASKDFLLGKWRIYNCTVIIEALTKAINERYLK